MSSTDTEQTSTPPVAKPAKLRHRQWGGATFWLLLAIGGLVAGRLGQLYARFDVFTQFSAQFIAMALGFSVALLFSRFKTFFGTAITVALLACYGAWPHIVSASLQKPPYPMADGETLLRLAHFNTYKNNNNFKAIAEEILRLDADVVSIVEASPEKLAAVLPLVRQKYPYSYDCERGKYCDMAILSVYPILSGAGEGEWEGAPYVRVSLGGPMSGVTVTGIHTTRFPYSRFQLRQVRELIKRLEWGPDKQIIMGDFNSTPFSRVVSTVELGANVKRLTELPTWPAWIELPQLAIDHVFASAQFRVVGNEQIGESVGSDHYPVVLTLALKAAP